jgi:hypothetical protein
MLIKNVPYKQSELSTKNYNDKNDQCAGSQMPDSAPQQ